MYKIQIPINDDIKNLVEEKASLLGLKNLNDAVRFLLTNFAQDRVKIILDPENTPNNQQPVSLVMPSKAKKLQNLASEGENTVILDN